MGLYTYAVVDETVQIPDLGIRTVDAGSIRAVVRDVDVAEYESPRLEENLQDPSWLETAVRDHERIVEHFLDPGPVVPMQFGSIFSAPEDLHAMLEANAAPFEALLDRVRSRQEWGVKLHVDVTAAARELLPAPIGGGGRAYLERRREEQRATERVAEQAATTASEVHRRLGEVAADATTLAVRPTPGTHPVVLNGAYLVPTPDVDVFLACVDELRDVLGRSHQLDVSGPWPPYSFTTVDVTGPR